MAFRDPELDIKIVNEICKSVGALEPSLTSGRSVNEPEPNELQWYDVDRVRLQKLQTIKHVIDKNFIYLAPANPLEQLNSFKKDFIQFKILDINLRMQKEINPMHKLKKRLNK
jgi:hypothetical protein